MSTYRKPYIDSSVFIEYIKGESEPLLLAMDSILKAAENGDFKIHISPWTIAEVHKRRGGGRLTDQQSVDLLPRFREDYMELIEIDRGIGERAHELCRDFPPNETDRSLKPGDAMHLAAAEKAGCDVVLTIDPGMLRLKYAEIRIEEPQIVSPAKALGPMRDTLTRSLFEESSIHEDGKG